MSDGHRGSYVAIGLIGGAGLSIVTLIWVIGLNYCPGDPCNYHRSPDTNPGQYEYYVPFSFGPYTSPGAEPEDAKGNLDYYNQKDLRAQESVARATNAIVLVSLFSVALGVLGTGLLVWNLVEARRATSETATASAAAIEANRLQVIGQRPWLDFKIRSFDNLQFPGDGRVAFSPQIKISNVGKTPAIDVRMHLAAYVGENYRFDAAISYIMDGVEDKSVTTGTNVFPDRSIRISNELLSDHVKATKAGQAPSGHTTHWLTLGVTYRDGMSKMHGTFKTYLIMIDAAAYENGSDISIANPGFINQSLT